MHAALQQHEGIGPATATAGRAGYRRHRPEDTVLYGVVEQQADAFFEGQGERGSALPRFVREEFEAYLRCGCLEHDFIGANCTGCRHEHPVAFSAIAPALLSRSVPDSPLPRPSMGSYLPHPCGRAANAAAGVRRAPRGVGPRVAHIWSTTCYRRHPYRQWVLSFPWPLRLAVRGARASGLAGCWVWSSGRCPERC